MRHLLYTITLLTIGISGIAQTDFYCNRADTKNDSMDRAWYPFQIVDSIRFKNLSGFIIADKYYQTLLENCEEITENPKIGKSYFNVEKSLLGLHVNKHIIFYRQVSEDFIEITRILHKMMVLKS